MKKEEKEKSVKKCSKCGHVLKDNMIFCDNCGTRIEKEKTEVVDSNTSDVDDLKRYINKIVSNNSLLSFIKSISLIVIFLYPLYQLLCSFNFLTQFIDYVSNIETLLLYGYLLCIIILYANKKYIYLICTFIIQIFNYFIMMHNYGFNLNFLIGIVIISELLFVIFGEYSRTNDYKKLLTDINKKLNSNVCKKCGATIGDEQYCHVCGTKQEPVENKNSKSFAFYINKFKYLILLFLIVLAIFVGLANKDSIGNTMSKNSSANKASIVGTWKGIVDDDPKTMIFNSNGNFTTDGDEYGTYVIYDNKELVLIYNNFDDMGSKESFTWDSEAKLLSDNDLWYVQKDKLYFGRSQFEKQ